MSKSSTKTYSLIELSQNSTSSDSNHLQVPSNNDESIHKNTEPYPPEHGQSGRVRFLKPHSTYPTKPILSKNSPRSVPSFESLEGSSIENLNDIHQDGPNSVSRGLQTDINSASVIDWVLAQKSSTNGERYIKT